MSGKTVELRDQVFSICLLPDSFMALMRFISAPSTHGPFLVERPMILLLPLLLSAATAAHDVAIGLLTLLTRAVAERRLAPRGHRVPTGRVVSLAAAVRVVDRIHRHAARLRSLALVAVAARLADLEVLVLGVGERANRGATLGADQPHLRRGQPQGHHLTLLRRQLNRRPR